MSESVSLGAPTVAPSRAASSADSTIAIVLPSLVVGGVERMRLRLAREFVRRGYRVDVVLMREEGGLLGEIPDRVRLVGLDAKRLRHAAVPLARYLRAERPAAVLAAMWPLTVVAVLAGLAAGRPRTVVSDHNLLSRQAFAQRWWSRAAIRATIRTAYPLAGARVAVSQGVAREIATLSGLPAASMTVIPNPACPAVTGAEAPDPWASLPGGARVLSVGRIKEQKGHLMLVEAFARVAATRSATLVILGDGPERPAVEERARDLGIADRVILPGFTTDTGPWYAHADVFALASRYEGFGNVLVEALAYGLPVVSTDSPTGPREVLDGGRYGQLVPLDDPEAMAQALAAALEDGQRGAPARRARAQTYAPGPIAERYLSLLFPQPPSP